MTWDEEIEALPGPVYTRDVVEVLKRHGVTRLDAARAHALRTCTLDALEFSAGLREAGITVGDPITPIR